MCICLSEAIVLLLKHSSKGDRVKITTPQCINSVGWFLFVVTVLHAPLLASDRVTGDTFPASNHPRNDDSMKRLPNIVYIMCDELAYFELSHMGNPYIKTPNIDRFAAQGIRFTNALAAAPVCAPLRCALMTGKHMGHASVRANGGGTPLRSDETTIAALLKQKGYATGGFGKWGAGGRDSTGVPEKHGFDVFYGYYDQVHAHSFYPPYLIRNSEEVVLDGNIGGRTGETYSHYSIMDEAFKFIRENQSKPFFCYLPITPPHGMYDIPKQDPAWDQYKNEDWVKDPEIASDVKNYAAMVSMVDQNVKQVLDLLEELNLENDTIVFFTGDNGGQDRFRSKQHPRGFFGPNVNPNTQVEFRGGKGSLYEGGLRIPFIARWPEKIAPGQVSDLLFYQVDVLPTLTELCGVPTPEEADGISILPTLMGEAEVGHAQAQHEYLYWEFGPQTAVRIHDWKGVQPKPDAAWQLYDLHSDPSESKDVADQHADIVAKMQNYAKQSHTPVRPGEFTTEIRHQKDRQAKWGTAKRPAKKRTRKNGKPRRISDPKRIAASQVKLTHASSENVANGKIAKNAIDGNSKTIWHSKFSGGIVEHPHELVIDLGRQRSVSGVRYLARQDKSWNGAFGNTEFSLANKPGEFGEPVLLYEFKKDRGVQFAKFGKPVTGRYLRVRVLSEVNDGPWASAADLGIIEN